MRQQTPFPLDPNRRLRNRRRIGNNEILTRESARSLVPENLFDRVLAKFTTIAQDERTVELVGV